MLEMNSGIRKDAKTALQVVGIVIVFLVLGAVGFYYRAGHLFRERIIVDVDRTAVARALGVELPESCVLEQVRFPLDSSLGTAFEVRVESVFLKRLLSDE